jgi:phytanoyl-CoA hydroxylase
VAQSFVQSFELFGFHGGELYNGGGSKYPLKGKNERLLEISVSLSQLAADYEKNGFAVIESAIAASDLDSIKNAAQNIVESFDVDQHQSVFSTRHQDQDRDKYFIESAEAVHCFLEEYALNESGELNRSKERAINKIGHAMHDLVPEFTRFCRLPIFAESMQALGFQSPTLWQTMYIFKQPQIGGEVRWHQDASYLIANNAGVIGCWVAIEDASKSNGCLWVEPGGHRSPLREIFEVSPNSPTGELRALDDTPWPDESKAIALEVPAGSIAFFSDRMPHYSSQNFSDRSRQAFTLHVTDQNAQWSERNWLQRRNLPPFLLA